MLFSPKNLASQKTDLLCQYMQAMKTHLATLRHMMLGLKQDLMTHKCFIFQKKTTGGHLVVAQALVDQTLKCFSTQENQSAATLAPLLAIAENILKFGTMFSCNTMSKRRVNLLKNLLDQTLTPEWVLNALFVFSTELNLFMTQEFSKMSLIIFQNLQMPHMLKKTSKNPIVLFATTSEHQYLFFQAA